MLINQAHDDALASVKGQKKEPGIKLHMPSINETIKRIKTDSLAAALGCTAAQFGAVVLSMAVKHGTD